MKHLFLLAVLPVVLMGWTSCTHSGKDHAALPDPRAVDKSVPEYKNPFHPSTYAHFVARKDYRKTYDVYKDDTLLNRKPKKSRKIFVCLDEQRGQYLVDGLIAGSDIWDSPMPKIHTTKAANYENDAYIVTQMRNAMHHILYTVVNSNAMNGWASTDTLKTITPWWQTAIYALIAVLAVLTILCAWQLSKALKRKKELADTAPAVDQK